MTERVLLSTVTGASGRGRVDWADYGSLHRFVMTRFGDLGSAASPRASGGVLFRAEAVRGHRRLLIQSTAPPIGVDRTIEISPMLDSLSSGLTCRLRLDVNPVRREARTGADRAVPEADLFDWTAGKLERAFTLTQLLDLRTDVRRVNRKKIVVAEIDALAHVVDPAKARQMVVEGVGRRKSHGCGLLSVLPLPTG